MPTELPVLMDTQQVAEYLGVSKKKLEMGRCAGTGPRFIRVGRLVRYRSADVADWIESNVREGTK